MFVASNRRVDELKDASPGSKEFHLYSVAFAFSQIQGKRHEADYDVSKTFSGSAVALDIDEPHKRELETRMSSYPRP
jgi:hypothetical protein